MKTLALALSLALSSGAVSAYETVYMATSESKMYVATFDSKVIDNSVSCELAANSVNTAAGEDVFSCFTMEIN